MRQQSYDEELNTNLQLVGIPADWEPESPAAHSAAGAVQPAAGRPTGHLAPCWPAALSPGCCTSLSAPHIAACASTCSKSFLWLGGINDNDNDDDDDDDDNDNDNDNDNSNNDNNNSNNSNNNDKNNSNNIYITRTKKVTVILTVMIMMMTTIITTRRRRRTMIMITLSSSWWARHVQDNSCLSRAAWNDSGMPYCSKLNETLLGNTHASEWILSGWHCTML